MTYTKEYFDMPIDRIGTACEKWDGIRQREKIDLLPMWVADMDFRCAPEITEALVKRASHPVYGYTEETSEAIRAMLDFMERRHQVKLNEDQQAMAPCVVSGLRAAVQCLTAPGDKVIVQPPVYGPFYASIAENGRETAKCPLLHQPDGSYQMDFNSIEDACKQGAKLMLLCNPHNPIGHAWSRQELTDLWQLLRRYHVALVSDEIHHDFILTEGAMTPMLNLVTEEDAPLVSMTSASKTFNLAGLQQAVLFSRNRKLLTRLQETMHQAGVVQGNIFAMAATEAAYRWGDSWLDGLLAYLREGEALLRKALRERLPKAVLSPMNATYLGWVDLRAYGFGDEELTARTHRQKVAFTTGTFFGREEGDGFQRINFACPHAQTLEAVKRLEQAIKE